MRAFDRILIAVIGAIALIFIAANLFLLRGGAVSGRPYRVEVNRIAREIETDGYDSVDLSEYTYVTRIARYGDGFYDTDSDYMVRKIGGELYRFDYSADRAGERSAMRAVVNIILGCMALLTLGVLAFVRQKLLRPFERLVEVPYRLSKGNLTAPVKESKSRFFGRFLWGVDLLRENMERQKARELDLQRERKTLLLSLSHDIKTPLSAIKLYAKALSRGLYQDKTKQAEIAESIGQKADEIEAYVAQIMSASREDFLSLEVNMGEFYLSQLLGDIRGYYSEKLALMKTDFSVGAFTDCLLAGDPDRSVEVLQNVMENAVKYGDGKCIAVSVTEEDGCILIAVKNSGCALSAVELPHIFESFWRGANAENTQGSGLGLYICRQLMHKMNGEIFADVREEYMIVTAVFGKAR